MTDVPHDVSLSQDYSWNIVVVSIKLDFMPQRSRARWLGSVAVLRCGT